MLVLPIPGHHGQSIALYDPKTKWLLTGDTVYPGKIYVQDWTQYRASIARLLAFTQNHPVEAIMGSHIEMTTRPGEHYPIGSQYHPWKPRWRWSLRY